jgi:import inner membrane translocase subunit TIM23
MTRSNGDDNEIEMVYIQDNPMMRIKDADRPKGTFLFLPMRTKMDKVFYGTGIAYFVGLGYGGLYGTYRGLVTAPNKLLKVRWNSILNQTTRYGPWAGNSLGILSKTVSF